MFPGYRFYDHKDAVQNQFSVMIHELAHATFVDADNPASHFKEIFPLNQIIALPANQLIWNSNNYAYYAACEFWIPSELSIGSRSPCPGVFAGCQTFPARPTGKMLKRQTASADTLVPAILDEYPYPTNLDTAALAANLTALGYEDKHVDPADIGPLQFHYI